MNNPEVEDLTPEQKLSVIRYYEKEVDNLLAEKKITKIDKERFNPLRSAKPEIILIARDILSRHGFNTELQ